MHTIAQAIPMVTQAGWTWEHRMETDHDYQLARAEIKWAEEFGPVEAEDDLNQLRINLLGR